jgi:hypothetical protein
MPSWPSAPFVTLKNGSLPLPGATCAGTTTVPTTAPVVEERSFAGRGHRRYRHDAGREGGDEDEREHDSQAHLLTSFLGWEGR